MSVLPGRLLRATAISTMATRLLRFRRRPCPPRRTIRAADLAIALTLVAIALPGIARGEPVADNEPAPSSVEEIEGGFGRILSERLPPPPLELVQHAWRKWVEDASPFWKEAEWQLGLRAYEFARLNGDQSRKETFAVGGRLGFTSGAWQERVRVGAALYTSQRVHGPEDRDGLSMLRPRQTGVTALAEAWLGVELAEGVELRAYRQALDFPYLNGNDSRMIPNTFEALVVQGRREDNLFALGHVTRMKPRDSGHFDSVSRVAGAELDRGLSLAGFQWEPLDGVSIGAGDLFAWDVFNVFYTDASWTHSWAADVGTQIAVQWTHQHSVGREALGAFTTHQAGVKLAVSHRGAILSAAWSSTDSEAGIRSPWGGVPGFLSLMRSDFDGAGQRGWLVGLSYDFGRLGWEGFTGLVKVARGEGARDPVANIRLSREREVDVTLDYRPENGRWHGLWLRLRVGWLDSGATRTARDVRILLNYDLSAVGE